MAQAGQETTPTGNLPHPVTAFVGRRAELSLARRAWDSSRLVTLTGPAGVGKTRLALRLASETEVADGVWLVELSPLQESALLAHVVAEALPLADQTTRPMDEVVAEYLAGRELLLVLDTCEHLVADCAQLVAMLLRRAPRLRVVVTSRQPLGLPEEYVLPVEPMTTAEGGDAVELLAVRAAEAVPGFTVNARNREAVLALCRRLDGIPLAIELAAVRLDVLSVEQLLTRLSSRMGLRHAGASAGEPRHRTLRTAVGWSHELCAPAERLLWARLSVFPGDFGHEAAVFVCSDVELFGEEVLTALEGLVEKSVVRRDGERFRVLDTVREYGAEWLARIGEEEELRQRHRNFFLHMARTFERNWLGPAQVSWRDRLVAEHANLRCALEFCLGPGDGTAVEMAGALRFFWFACGFQREGRHYLDLALAADSGTRLHRTRALWAFSLIATTQGDAEASLCAAETALFLAEEAHAAGEAGAAAEAAMARYAVAGSLAVSGDHEGAVRVLTAALRVPGLADAPQARLMTLGALAYARLGQGDFVAGGAFADQLRTGCEEYGECWLKSFADYFSGVAALGQHEPATAVVHGRASLEIKRRLRDTWGVALTISLLASAAAATGDGERAARLLGFNQRIWQTFSVRQVGDQALAEAHRTCEEQALAAIGRDAYEAAYRTGLASLTIDGGIAYAMGDGLVTGE